MAITPWVASYPFSDPIFQSFNVQQYYTQSGVVGPTQMYSEKAPELPEKVEEAEVVEAEVEEKKAGK